MFWCERPKPYSVVVSEEEEDDDEAESLFFARITQDT
jgi:hypothetical protein